VNEAINQIESGKAPGVDNVFPNFLKRLGLAAKK